MQNVGARSVARMRWEKPSLIAAPWLEVQDATNVESTDGPAPVGWMNLPCNVSAIRYLFHWCTYAKRFPGSMRTPVKDREIRGSYQLPSTNLAAGAVYSFHPNTGCRARIGICTSHEVDNFFFTVTTPLYVLIIITSYLPRGVDSPLMIPAAGAPFGLIQQD